VTAVKVTATASLTVTTATVTATTVTATATSTPTTAEEEQSAAAPVPPVPPPPPPPMTTPTAVAHEMEWFKDDPATLLPINGHFPQRSWSVCTHVGSIISAGSDKSKMPMKPLEYFLLMFPPDQIELMWRCTNEELVKAGKRETTMGETLKLFGVLILLTRFEFADDRLYLCGP
jgi:hypothetical protein